MKKPSDATSVEQGIIKEITFGGNITAVLQTSGIMKHQCPSWCSSNLDVSKKFNQDLLKLYFP